MKISKRVISAVLVAVMLISAFPLSAAADTATGTVTGSYVYIRSGPGTGNSVLGGCLKGSSVKIISEQSGWYKISYNNIEGYMSSAYIEKSGSGTYGTVTGSVVNLRSGPGTSNSIVAMVTAGTQLPVLDSSGDWYKVAYNESTAYISADYFKTTPGSTGDTGSTGTGSSSGSTSGSSGSAVTVTGTGRVNYAVVNLRSGPGTTYSIVAVLVKDRALTVTAEVNGWYRVDFNGSEAYIDKSLLTLSPDAVIPSGTIDISGTGTVTGAVVNVRSGPGTGYSVVGQVTAGRSYPVSGESNGWYKINFNGMTAYISASYMKVAASSSTVTVGTVTANHVNIRSGAGTGYGILGQANYGDTFNVISKNGAWFYVSSATGLKGYISASYLTTSVYDRGSEDTDEEDVPEFTVYPMSSTGLCVFDSVNVRKYPNTDCDIIGELVYGDEAPVTGYSNGWYRIEIDGKVGFVNGNYFLVTETGNPDSGSSNENSGSTPPAESDTPAPPAESDTSEPPAESDTSEPPAVENPPEGSDPELPPAGSESTYPEGYDAELANEIVNYAMTFIGIPYRYGGSSPSTGFDCSGLTQYVYKHFGYNICRTTQYKEGFSVSRDELLPGDLVFFNTTGYGIGHVGMYVGNNQFIHSPTPGKTVCITRMDTDYYNPRFVCAVRIIGS